MSWLEHAGDALKAAFTNPIEAIKNPSQAKPSDIDPMSGDTTRAIAKSPLLRTVATGVAGYFGGKWGAAGASAGLSKEAGESDTSALANGAVAGIATSALSSASSSGSASTAGSKGAASTAEAAGSEPAAGETAASGATKGFDKSKLISVASNAMNNQQQQPKKQDNSARRSTLESEAASIRQQINDLLAKESA